MSRNLLEIISNICLYNIFETSLGYWGYWAIFYRLFLSEVYLENSRENPAKSADFTVNLSLKIPQNLTFFSATYQKPCIRHSQAVFFLFFSGKTTLQAIGE